MVSDVVKIICIGDAAAKYLFSDFDELCIINLYNMSNSLESEIGNVVGLV